MTIADLLGILGFVLSLALSFLYLRDYFHPLKMFVSAVEVHYKNDAYSLLVLHIDFVNRSSVGKIVCQISYGVNSPYDSYIVGTVYQTDTENGRLLVVDKNEKPIAYIPLSDYLECPLDIQPHQSQNKCYPLLLAWNTNELDRQVGKISFVIVLRAHDVNNKVFASATKTIDDNDLHRSVYIG